ncbi:MAG: hypothetical protein QW241_04645 [Candidatus Bathyarchaeia archaeon]
MLEVRKTDRKPLTKTKNGQQIQMCICSESKLLLSADEELINTALKKGIRAVNIKDESEVETSLKVAMKNGN